MGCKWCSSGLGKNCKGILGGDDIHASCSCECHNCDICGSPYCENVGGNEECEEDSEDSP